jgi:tetratricopeptide (TPR) repeat protein
VVDSRSAACAAFHNAFDTSVSRAGMAHQLTLKPRFGTQSRALIADSQPTARSVLAAQLRALGVDQITQCARAGEVRQHMAAHSYDVFVCEHALADGALGQDLIDDLRRRQQLSLGTVVVMVSSEASYRVVAQVAESALDGFVIKPYSVGDLEDRVLRAFARKESLKDIIEALDAGRFDEALAACEQRFGERGPYWTSAARIGAELAIRQGRLPLATVLFDAVIEDRAVPWAKLGLARVLEAGDRKAEALSTLEGLLSTETQYADAYDVMGRIYTEQGNFAAAINAYRQAAKITPASVQRAQKFGILAHYAGDPHEAMTALERAVAVGLTSPHFDPQTLLLLTICRYRAGDAEGLAQCREALEGASGGVPGAASALDDFRRERLAGMCRLAQGFEQLLDGDFDGAARVAGELAGDMHAAGFDAEAATNLLALLSAIVAAGGELAQGPQWVRALGLRFCVSKHTTEVLARACDGAPMHADLLRTAHTEIGEATRGALSAGLAGRHHQTVEALLGWAERTLNAKMLEVAEATLARYKEHLLDGIEGFEQRCEVLRGRCGRSLRARLLAETQEAVPAGAWMA